jgi:hypothetical protein
MSTVLSRTNEQEVIALESELESLKQKYHARLMPIAVARQRGQGDPSITDLLECQNLGNAYFNAAERFVGNSGVLGAHLHGKWVTGLAETCHSILGAYITHIGFLRSHNAVLGGVGVEPSEFAYANMQRMVKEYLPKKQSDELMGRFVENKLPIKGFTVAAAQDQNRVTKWQRIISVVVGVVAVAGVVVLSVLLPNPTPWQQYVFRGCLAIGLAALGALVPGFLNVALKMKGYLTVMAGGSLAIFVLLWMYSPKPIQSEGPTQKTPLTRPAE